MSASPSPSRADREAQRALLEDAIAGIASAPDPQRAASDVMRALDHYIESAPRPPAPREAPVTDYAHREQTQTRWAMWIVLGTAALGTAIIGIVMSGGWPAAIAIIAIWVLALGALVST